MLMGLTACAVAPLNDDQAKSAQKYWPDLPLKPRYVHEGSLRFIDDVRVENQVSKLKQQIVGVEEKKSAFQRPYDVVAQFGRIYVSDSDAGLISVYDVPRHQFYQIGKRLAGKLFKPMGLALDSQSNIYVADIGSKSIQVFDFLGMHLRSFGEKDGLQQPISVAVDSKSEQVYVVDNGGIDSALHRVLVYDKQGTLIRTIGQRGHEAGEFNLPTDAVVGRDGTLYVLDSGNFRVQMFNPQGELINQWGSAGSGFGQFARPRSIGIDFNENIYVTDMFFGNVQVFNKQGQLLLPIGKLDDKDDAGNYRLISGITVDETQRVYVVDQFFKKVDVYRYLSGIEGEQLVRLLGQQ